MIPDTVLGHYRILRLLGQGGMGEVYAAEDTRLHRTVALKMLPHAVAADPDRRKRLEREAQAVAALNHPNIVTIYSVEEAGDVMFLTMELVEGRTLKEMMDTGALPLETVLRVAIAMSDALSAAHQRGIAHRDLKPANIMVTPDGRVKVLDFGLAKLRESERKGAAEHPTRLQSDLTGEGRIIGTVAYMSPEQAEGKPVDQRSDIFSAGVVLHEMAAGERPFKGDTDISLISSILKDTPSSVTDLRPDLPAGLARIVRRCLMKDPERRVQTATDLRNDLEELKQDLASGTAAKPAPVAATGTRRGVRTLAVALVAAVIATGLFAWFRFGPSASSPAAMTFTADHFTPLTNSGSAYLAALSRDRRYVVHVKDEHGRPSVWLRQTATTSDVPIVPPDDLRMIGLTFSPDGNYVYYVAARKLSALGSLYRVPVLGGASNRVLEDIDSAPSFSPDGRRFAFVRGMLVDGVDTMHLMVAGIDGSGARTISVGDGSVRFRQEAPAWSPDGKTILVPASQNRVSAVDSVSGAARVIGEPWVAPVSNPQWMPDGRSFVVEAADSVTAREAHQLWEVGYPSGERRRITNDMSGFAGVSLSADGTLLATVQSSRQAKIWIAPPGGGAAREIGEGPGRAMGTRGVSWTPDGRIVFTADSGGVMQLWIEGANGAGLRQLTTGEGPSVMPAVSADGRWVYYTRFASDGPAIWRMGIDGSDQKQLTKRIDGGTPVPSPDGRFVYFTARLQEGKIRTMRVPADGGEPSQVADAFFSPNDISPDGRELMGISINTTMRRVECAVLPTTGGAPRLLGDVPLAIGGLSQSCRFDGKGTAIAYVSYRDGVMNVFAQPLSGGAERPVTRFRRDAFPEIFGGAMSPDGRLAVSRGNTTRDVVLIAAK